MEIKKFETYTRNEDGDISVEYAKIILSKYIDDQIDDKSLEDAFYNIGENVFENHAESVKTDLIDLLRGLLHDAHTIRTFVEIKADKYNL